jgi:hypothetical protein
LIVDSVLIGDFRLLMWGPLSGASPPANSLAGSSGKEGVAAIIRNASAALKAGCYTGRMRSVADSLRDETRQQTRRLSPEARLERSLALGDEDVQALCDARGVSAPEARAIIARSRRAGRRPSRAHGD